MGQGQLAERVTALGVPMRLNTVSRMENGTRVADVPELLALSIALGVAPNRLLLTADADNEAIALTPTLSVAACDAWKWARGHLGLTDEGVPVFGDDCFQEASRPDDPPDHTTIREMEEHASQINAVHRETIRAAEKQGVPLRLVYAGLRMLDLPRRLGFSDSAGEDPS